jgi:capsular polysaccharide biosynthesis protein
LFDEVEDAILADVPLHQHWHDIYVRRWLVVLTAITAAIAAYIFSGLVTPMYEAKTTFYLAANATPARYIGPVPDAPPAPLLPTPEEKAASLDVGILRGREVRMRLASQFGLTVDDIERRVDVTVSGEFMIDVFARNPDAQMAANIANAVPMVYADFHERSMRTRAMASADALKQQLAMLNTQRAAVQAQLRDNRSASLTTADQAALGRLQDQRDAAQVDLDGLTGQINTAQARQTALAASLQQEAGYYAQAQTVSTTPTLDKMLESVLDLQVDLAALSDGTTSPRRVAIEDQLHRIEQAVAVERKRLAEAATKAPGSLYEDLRLEMALNAATIAGLQAALKAADTRLAQATDRFDTVLSAVTASDDAGVALARIDGQITQVDENLAAAALQADHATPPIVIVEQAIAPTRAAFPLPFLNAVVAALCGIVFGTYYALFVAHSERSAQVRKSRAAAIPLFSRDELNDLTAPSAIFLRNPVRGGGRG